MISEICSLAIAFMEECKKYTYSTLAVHRCTSKNTKIIHFSYLVLQMLILIKITIKK